MSPKFKSFLKVGLTIAETMVPQIATVEKIARTIPTLTGKAKADAVIQTTVEGLLAAEGITAKDFVQDEKFRAGVQMVNDGYVLIMQAIQGRERAPKKSKMTA
jgi:hypothetical protein